MSFGYWKRFKEKVLSDPCIKYNLIILGIMLGLVIIGPCLSTYHYAKQDLQLGASAPSSTHWLGTDILGRDLLVRILYGGRVSFGVSLSATFLAIVIGGTYGAIAGWNGKWLDRCMMRFVDLIYPLPFTVLVMLLMAYCGQSFWLLFVAIGAVKWLTLARIVRNQVMHLKKLVFVEVAYSLGQKPWKIFLRHVLPHLTGILIIYGTLLFPSVILEEAFISFLGFGIQPPKSSWGLLILEGAKSMEIYPWLLLFPSLFFILTLFCFHFLGDGLRDILDEHSEF